MSSKVVLRKNGGFYSVYGDDAFILYYLLNYKIIGDKVGFPNSALNKVVNLLEDNHISYEVDGNIYDFKNRNKYKKILDLGRRKCSLDILEMIYIANIDNNKELKIKILSKLSMLDFYLERSYKNNIISEKVLKKYSNKLASITKLIYGWLRSESKC